MKLYLDTSHYGPTVREKVAGESIGLISLTQFGVYRWMHCESSVLPLDENTSGRLRFIKGYPIDYPVGLGKTLYDQLGSQFGELQLYHAKHGHELLAIRDKQGILRWLLHFAPEGIYRSSGVSAKLGLPIDEQGRLQILRGNP